MPRWYEPEDDEDFDSDEEEPTVPCPHCRRPVHEDAFRCPHCENYISQEDAPPARKPWWILLGVGACLFVIIYLWVLPH